MFKVYWPLVALCLVLLAALACGGPVTPTPTLAATQTVPTPLSTLVPAQTATVVEQVVTLTPKPLPSATKIAISATAAAKASATNLPQPSPTRTRPPAPTNTRAPAFTRTPAPVVLPTDTAVPVIVAPTDTPVPQPTSYDRNGDGKVTCADFDTQAEAQAAYNAGYKNLDGSDNDGLACESLP